MSFLYFGHSQSLRIFVLKRTAFAIFCALFVLTDVSAQTPDSSLNSFAESLCREGLRSGKSYEYLTSLVRTAGHRLSGSEGAAKAVQWSLKTFQSLGVDSAWTEPVMVPHWVRGHEEGSIRSTSTQKRHISVSALGGSVATPAKGITAEVIEVRSFDELRTLGGKAKGKIVFFNRPMDPAALNPFEAYGKAVDQRGRGAIEAAKAGGVAALVRSMTTKPDDVPHTGAMQYDTTVSRIPAAAVGIQSAELISSLLAKGETVEATLQLDCKTLPDAESANVIAEIRGSEFPNEIVVIGGHLDSWDQGDGAHDDGAGCVQAVEALRLIKESGKRPQRTIRAVLWMNEENGLRGAFAYANARPPHERHLIGIEADAGGGVPLGFTIQGGRDTVASVRRLSSLLAPIGADKIFPGGGGADLIPLTRKGMPGMVLAVNPHRYFDYHHSANDVLEAVHPRELQLGACALAVMAYALAEEGL